MLYRRRVCKEVYVVCCVWVVSRKEGMFENVSLSRMTVQRRIVDISTNLSDQLKQRVSEISFLLKVLI
jgi:hypothetical protein